MRFLLLFSLLAASSSHAQSILLDPGYGSTDVAGFNIRISDFQADADGRALVVRGTGFPPASELAVFRVDALGRLDPSFGSGGRRTLPLPRDTSRSALIAVGQVLPEGDGSTRLVLSAGGTLMTGRLRGDGTLDPAFVPDGLRRVALPFFVDLADARADGGRTLALSRVSYAPYTCALTALTAAGQPDLSFGTAGTAVAPTDRSCLPVGIVTTPEGPLVLARLRESDGAAAESVAMFAFTPTGDVRTSFGDRGTVVLPFDDLFRAGNAVAWAGRLVVGGTRGAEIVFAAFTGDGRPDLSFGGTGVFRTAPIAGSPMRGTVGLAKGGDGLLVFTTSTDGGSLVAGALTTRGALVRQETADGLFSRLFSYSDVRLYRYSGSSVAEAPGGNVLVAATMTLSGSSYEGARLSRLLLRVASAADGAEAPAGVRVSAEPNPLSASSRVTLALDAAATASVRVVDALGRTVAVLADGPLAAGAHAFALDASGLPAGVYAVVATVGGTQRVTRVTIVR